MAIAQPLRVLIDFNIKITGLTPKAIMHHPA